MRFPGSRPGRISTADSLVSSRVGEGTVVHEGKGLLWNLAGPGNADRITEIPDGFLDLFRVLVPEHRWQQFLSPGASIGVRTSPGKRVRPSDRSVKSELE